MNLTDSIYFQEAQEAPASSSTAYDTIWVQEEIPVQQPIGTEKVMLAEDKLYVVLAVVLIIWIGLAYYIFKTDRKILALEQSLQERSTSESI